MPDVFSYDELSRMIAGLRPIRGRFHMPCPVCGPECRQVHNRRRRVLSVISSDRDDGLVYHCIRCEIRGVAFRGGSDAPVRPIARAAKDEPDNSKLAGELWARSAPLRGTAAERYLRRRECLVDSPNVRFLAGGRHHHHAMIARFASKDGGTRGVHLTRINADGGKADIEPVKIMLGPSAGWPIIVHDAGGSLDALCIAEGIEDAASMALATGLAAWAAGSAGRIAGCLRRAKRFAEVVVAVDDDPAGARALADARAVRPGLAAVVFRIDGESLDANATLRLHGAGAVKAFIEYARRNNTAAREAAE